MAKQLVSHEVLHEHLTSKLGFNSFSIESVHLADGKVPEGVRFVSGVGRNALLEIHSIPGKFGGNPDIVPVRAKLRMKEKTDVERAAAILPLKG